MPSRASERSTGQKLPNASMNTATPCWRVFSLRRSARRSRFSMGTTMRSGAVSSWNGTASAVANTNIFATHCRRRRDLNQYTLAGARP